MTRAFPGRRFGADDDIAYAQHVDDDSEAPVAVDIAYGPTGHDGDGWYYWEAEYPEEGSTGAFGTEAEARVHAVDAGYAVPDEQPTCRHGDVPFACEQCKGDHEAEQRAEAAIDDVENRGVERVRDRSRG